MSADPPKPSGNPGRQRPSVSDLSRETTEDDLWNLDDDIPDKSPAKPKAPPTKRAPATSRSVNPDKKTNLSEGKETKTPSRQAKHSDASEEIDDLDEPEDPPEDDIVTLVQIKDEKPDRDIPLVETPPIEEPEAKAKSNQKKNSPLKGKLAEARLKRPEVIGLATFAVAILAVAVWLISSFFNHLRFKSDFVEIPDFPVKGEIVILKDAQPYWREPIREGDSIDVARREAVIIPILEITLDPENSRGGALRIVFRDGEGGLVGDSITRSFSGGQFDASGQEVLEFASTDGFVEMATFRGYREGEEGDPWTAEILEGASVNAPATTFKPLVTVPLLPLRR